ncbi:MULTISPECIES: TetR/AcrR family transcriptional regulator [Actinosynnema]|uniref:TetR/AcrR family transcriptional regulator n=1 Tax=Actinosynnema TaxID=40566 RepID=UPI0020A3E5F3|nr:WHG domain-containing protein [Actinosynnema pretiosum]MCP2094662.1 transcriptional regulator, TetR family [Actinosynnema pretiosum]
MTRAGLTTERLVRAGADLADELGFDRLTASELARRVGVKVASLYSHVAGFDDLRARIAAFALAELADQAADALAGRSGRDALAALGGAYRDYARRCPGRYAATRSRVAPQDVAVGRRHSDLARAVLRGYDLPEAEHVHAVRFMGSVFHGYAELELAGSFQHSEPDSATSWQRALDALDAALRAWPTPR